MRPDRTSHRYGVRPSQFGPSTITKEISPEDSCHRCIISYGSYYGYDHINTAFRRPDPLGIDGFFVPYSLNKKKRWTLPRTLVRDIEQFQEPQINLRVSVSMHDFDRAYYGNKNFWSNELRYRITRECHSVTREGRVTRHVAAKGQQMMKTLLHSWDGGAKPWRPRKQRWQGAQVENDWREPRAYLGSDDEEEDQKLHLVYSVVDVPTKPTEYAQLAPKRKTPRRDRISRHRQKRITEWKSDDGDDEEEEETETDYAPSDHVTASLSSFLIPSIARRQRLKKKTKQCYMDEAFRSSTKRQNLIRYNVPVRWTWQDEETDEDNEEAIVEDVVIVPITPLPQLFTRIRMVDSALRGHPTLPVYPRSWEIHRGDTARVLGQAYPVCIIAKELNEEEIGLFAQENCLRCAEHWGRIRILFEEGDHSSKVMESQSISSSCSVCCKMMNNDAVNEFDRPFSLSCGHASCTGCWLRCVSDGMKKGDCPTICPDESCSMRLSITAAAALLDSASMRKYSEAVAEALLHKQIARCAKCSRLRWIASSRPIIRCECGSVVCARCSSRAHLPVSCDIYHAYNNYIDTCGMKLFTYWLQLPEFVCLKMRSMELAFDVRIAYYQARMEVDDRLQCLSIRTRKEFSEILEQLTHLAQMCSLHSRKSKRCLMLAQRIQFAMWFFYNTKDRNRRNLLYKTELIKKILNDIEQELFM